jgi:hypothetical protein
MVTNKIEAIAFNAWLNSLHQKGFPRKESGAVMDVWELYEYWEKNIEKTGYYVYADDKKNIAS